MSDFIATAVERDGKPVSRIEWPDGAWWEVLTYKPHKVSRRIKVMIGAAMPDTPDGEIPFDRREFVLEQAERAHMVMLTGCTAGWSFDAEVCESNIDELDSDRVQDVISHMRDLYRVAVDPAVENEEKKS